MPEIEWAVGMKVALTEGYCRTPEPRTVKRVTPSGMPVIAGVSEGSERKFAKDGRERGRSGGYYGRPRIEPWTTAHDKTIAEEHHKYLHRVLREPIHLLRSYTLDEIGAACAELRAKQKAS